MRNRKPLSDVELEFIQAPIDLPTGGDERARAEGEQFAGAAIAYWREAFEDLRSTRALRTKAAKQAYWYLIGLSFGVFTLLLLHGFRVFGFNLDALVLTTLSGGTFVSAIGVFGFVVQGLFPKPARPAKKR